MVLLGLLWTTIISLASVKIVDSLPHNHAKAKPAYFALAGDSTTAKQSSNGGGWGDGFLNHTLESPSTGHNYGHNGATTVSFVAGGDWATVLSTVKNKTADYAVYVTIQFGHNDQKAAANISLEQYKTNLQNLAKDVQANNAVPILVTPLTRRNFNGTPPRVTEDLAVQRNLTIEAAIATNSRWIDLNAASIRYVNEIGPEASWKYNLNPDDYTHLNSWGSVVFGRLVSDLMGEKYADIRAVTKKNQTLSAEIQQGIPA